jgi:hypothetical protein
MVTFSPSKSQSRQHPSIAQIRKDKHKKIAVLLAGLGAAVATSSHALSHLDKNPIHTSALTGQMWLDELLAGE